MSSESGLDAGWNRCDVCGRFIPLDDFAPGKAVRRLITPDSEFTPEEYETLCKADRAALAALRACKYGDPYCPCQDGDICHYEGENPFPPPAAYLAALGEK